MIGVHTSRADYFECYEGCTNGNGALEGSSCTEHPTTGDWHTTCSGQATCPDAGSDVTVLSHHGGRIEIHTSTISADLSDTYGWNRYDLSGHLVSGGACDKLAEAEGMEANKRNYGMLHVTSTHFNHAEALTLVGAHPHAVSIHGCGSSSCANSTICIGGANTSQIDAFKDYVDTYKGVLPYALDPAKVQSSDTAACKAKLRGSSSDNIVNKSSSGNGGLQLEMSRNVRNQLVSSSVPDDLLRGVIYGGVAVAMGEVPLPLAFLNSTETYTIGANTFTRYRLRVENTAAIPAALFTPAPTLPPCGLNTKGCNSHIDVRLCPDGH
ncbi:poly-gamma-glutamate hydrolase family protein [Candidatus Entotheonella palauensis]|uniref:poly-gamma-glutamate hydrolase family protein n=1 Tax=Candidatus Entotheonella palauensis TaxID=93172 RepID=UPI0035303864